MTNECNSDVYVVQLLGSYNLCCRSVSGWVCHELEVVRYTLIGLLRMTGYLNVF